MKDKELDDLEEKDLNKEVVKKRRKNIIFSVLALILMIGVGYSLYYYIDSNTYFSTDNAKVTLKTYSITPTASGKLVKYTVAEGSKVKENEVIGRVEGAYLKSPVDGKVLKSNVTLNQIVSPATVVCVIGETNNVYVGVNIEETNIKLIKEGQPVKVKLDAFPGKTFKGHVSSIDPVTQTALSGMATSFSTSGTYVKTTQLIPIKVVIDDDVSLDGIIGTNANVKIKVK
ncbi:MAG: efflux RND transporter periplasmic adaptor subunit [Bacteroidota bacterium]|nr:efflux RND transporter periplasmic adaptor subunit [Bacteroidota bacterium]